MIYKSQMIHMVNVRPLVYYWIAHWKDDTSLPQFDLKTFKENSFRKVINNHDKLKSFGLYPFTKELAEGVSTADYDDTKAVPLGFLPVYEVVLKDGEKIIHYRDGYISQESYHKCRKCNKEFYYDGKHSHIIKDRDLSQGIKMGESVPICPHCGAYDYYECKECSRKFEKYNETDYGMCPDCSSKSGRQIGFIKLVRITSGSFTREKRKYDYFIGKQVTVNNTNLKFIIKIQENGNSCVI